MSTGRLVALISAALVLLSGSWAQEVVRCPYPERSLSDRWSWASSDGKRAAGGEEFWVGYSIRRLMSENSFIVSGNDRSRMADELPTLREILSGARSPQAKRAERWDVASKPNVVKVMKEIAILLRVKGDISSPASVQKIELSDLDFHFDARSAPMIWLGSSDDDQSVRLLSGLFDGLSPSERKRDALTAIGLHQNSNLVFPFLSKILKGDESDNVRSQAAFWIGQQDVPTALEVLVDVARNDRSLKVREQAVFAISQLRSEKSTDALIEIARKGPDSKTRGTAVFWLGQEASQRAVATLDGIVADEAESDVQRQALFALAQMHTSDVVDRLIKIAETHDNPRLRKQAVQLLGQSDDPKALNALIKIVRK